MYDTESRVRMRDTSDRAAQAAAEINRIVGRRLRDLRRERGVPVEQIAMKAGITISELLRYESAADHISAKRLPALARALGVRMIALFDGAAYTGRSSSRRGP